MIPDEQNALWLKILQFPLDDEAAARPFSTKLAVEQNWSPEYTKRAIAEYRRFLFLCCISPSGAAPSAPVDEVWHQHLTYTRSYWVDLCQGVLGRELHHFPSTGGPAEDSKHREWYKATLRLYRTTFDLDPPADIWPAPPAPLVLAAPELPRFNWNSRNGWLAVALLVVPYVFIGLAYGTYFPFSLGGPHFLIFFPIFSLTLFTAYAIVRNQVKRSVEALTEERFPGEASAFQIAEFLYGKTRALQATILDLTRRKLLEVTDDNRFLITNDAYIPSPHESNPLIRALATEQSGTIRSYTEIATYWYDREQFRHPVLDALDRAARRKEPFFDSPFFAVLFFGMCVVRAAQGMANHRPVVLLFVEMVVLSIIFYQLWRRFALVNVLQRKVRSLYQAQAPQQIDEPITRFALQGTPALAGIAEGAALTSLFIAYQPGSGGYSSDGSMSADSGSSCSGGSSCGSGGSSCGSSCGGCSGN